MKQEVTYLDPCEGESQVESSTGGVAEVAVPVGGGADLAALKVAATAWIERGRAEPIGRWLERALDGDGVPRGMAVSDWLPGLQCLAGAGARRPSGWPERFDALAEGWFRALLRFSRPDGTTVFGQDAPRAGRRSFFRAWAARLSDPGLSTVVDWWFPGPSGGRHAPPPLPSDARPDRPLAVLRASWMRDGDLVAVDQRDAGTSCHFELFGQGRAWLGPSWCSGAAGAGVSRARPTLRQSHSSADVVEWSYRVGRARVVRTAVLLRGRRIAVLAEQWDGPDDPGEMRLGLPPGVEAGPVAGSRGLALTRGRGRASARVFPVGLPRLDYPTDRGSFSRDGRALVLRQRAAAGVGRVWRVLLVSWEPRRNRQPVHWRTLTVSEKSRPCAPDAAFAARLTWGRDETLLIYRSLARPAVRAFLGHQTRARFLVGLFTAEGEVEPLVKVDE